MHCGTEGQQKFFSVYSSPHPFKVVCSASPPHSVLFFQVTGIVTFALAYSSRVYVYQLSKLVVRVEPEPSVIYVVFVSFLYWFVSLLVLASALLSNTGINVTSSLFYVLLQAFGAVFYVSGGICLLALESSQSVATAAGVFAIISGVLHGVHALLVYVKKKK